tara:strand:- start:113 stop:1174 length:1062 start_codon:yes stop_codon:yes gene_type:complete
MAYTTIDDGSKYFQAITYSGNSNTSHAVTNTGNSTLQPDWIWVKIRTGQNDDHVLVDSSRGNLKRLKSNQAYDEEADRAEIKSFDSNGFTLGTDDGSSNYNGFTYVAWQWKANGGTTTTNDASATGVGNLDSVYQANTTAGFSIVTWTGVHPGNHTVAHGLGIAPKAIIFKNRSDNNNWQVRHASLAAYQKLPLNDTTLPSTDYNLGHDMGTTTFALQNSELDNGNGDSMIAYCFAPIQGYSNFGKYTGTNNADGTFVYTGFKPAWLMVKKTTDNARAWVIHDNKQDPDNPTANRLDANTNEVNQSSGHFDFLSNGFKCRSTEGATNASSTYIYFAFAEHPFVSSKGVPVTAR